MSFRNLDGSGPQPLRAVFKWGVVDSLLGRRRRSPATASIPQVALDPARVATPPGQGEPARLTWLGHASWLVQLDGRSFLIDPVFGRVFPRIPRVVPAPLSPERLPKIDAVLISHSHYDHLDLPSVRKVNAEVVAGTGMTGAVRSAAPSVRELAWWEETDVGGVRIAFVPAQHWSKRAVFDTNTRLWGGFVIQGSSATIYHSGDTAYFDGFAEIGRRYPVDAALLPIGAYDPEWFMRRQHMTPEDAARAFVDLKARAFFAMHWGTFKLTDEPLDEPPQRLRAEWERLVLDAERLHVMAVGEIADVGR